MITTEDQFKDAMGNNSSRIIIDKASISSQAAGTFVSLWRATGQPGQGAIPTTAARCNNTTLGGINFNQQTSPATSYLALYEGYVANAGSSIEIHDRLMQMGGLVGNVATAQTVNLDLHANIGSDNLAERIGDADYSDVTWWMEWYSATGSTAVTATVAVTYNDGTTGNISVALAATRPASHMTPLNGLIPAGDSGKYIRDIDTVTLSATTGTAGNIGFTATRYRAAQFHPIANSRFTSNWMDLGLPNIPNASCLFPIMLASTTTSGIVRATGKIIHG